MKFTNKQRLDWLMNRARGYWRIGRTSKTWDYKIEFSGFGFGLKVNSIDAAMRAERRRT